MKIMKSTLPIFFAVLISTAANADIAAFNQAMQTRDYAAAAKETLDIWSTFDKDSAQAATVAREFGFVNYLARDYDNAEMFSRFLVDQGAELTVPDDQPATSKVLLGLTLFSAKRGDEERQNLAEAIEHRLDADGIDQISMLAAETLYKNDWAAGQWAAAQKSAALAETVYSRGGEGYVKQRREAELASAAADFVDVANHRDYARMVDLHNRLVKEINDGDASSKASSLLELKWDAQAWVHTMEAFFHSYYSQMGTIINSRLKYQDLQPLTARTAAEGGAPDQLPVCPGSVDVGELSYPMQWADRRMVGSVILNLSFNEHGEITNSEILGEAPPGVFSPAVDAAVTSFTWKINPGVDRASCCLNQEDYIYVIGFWNNCVANFVRGDCPGTKIKPAPDTPVL